MDIIAKSCNEQEILAISACYAEQK